MIRVRLDDDVPLHSALIDALQSSQPFAKLIVVAYDYNPHRYDNDKACINIVRDMAFCAGGLLESLLVGG